jgi:hypothetical protein
LRAAVLFNVREIIILRDGPPAIDSSSCSRSSNEPGGHTPATDGVNATGSRKIGEFANVHARPALKDLTARRIANAASAQFDENAIR